MHAGIDVSKNWVDVSIAESGARLERARPLQAAKWLKRRKVGLVVLEASGGYELPMLAAVSRVNPRQARQFAGAVGQHGKSDRADAALLARYAATLKPEPTTLPSAALVTLRGLCERRRTLVMLRTAERNRRAMASEPLVVESIAQLLAMLETQIVALQREIAAHIAQHPELAERQARLRTMPGIGPVTAAMLIATLPELGEASRTEIAALAGLAPFTRQSGVWQGRAFCSGGRASVRACLYMAALAATRQNNRFADTYQRLTARGKPHKVALTATMRVMLTTLNTMEKNKTCFSLDQ